ncbi:MAG TPA: pyridoxal-phosphate dependent enzyme [Opitutaceae bacterium]|nr:pyridoxal-phosphate dependent enzyme [Opitutaceae bacterium]
MLAARDRLAGVANRTPVLTSRTLDAMTGAHVFFKCENFQRVGAFKFRGAFNAVASLDDAAAVRGVVAHSSGNHAAAVSLAARIRGIAATIVLPRDAARAKIASVERCGGRIVYSEPTVASREEIAARIVEETGAVFIHPSNDARVIAGQGTAALELVEEIRELDAIVTPVSGGGLLGGTALAAHGIDARIRVFGAEPSGADDAMRSLAAGRIVKPENPQTICDGLRSHLGASTFPILREHVTKIITVPDEETTRSMRLVWEVLKVLVEPSSAIALAAVLASPDEFRGARVGVIFSGGNVDLDQLPWG